MNKTKRTLIISSCIMALAFVVTIVSVSAAWFGDMKSASTDVGFVIESDTLQDSASIDINSSKGMTGESIYPAIAELGYFLKNGAVAPTGAVLKGDALPDGVAKKAEVATVYFPIQYVGAPDKDFEAENRKSLHIEMMSANIGKLRLGNDGNYIIYDRTGKLPSSDGMDNFAGNWGALGQSPLYFDGEGSGTFGANAFVYTLNSNDGSISFNVNGKDYTVELVDYKDEFNVDVCLVEAQLNDSGAFDKELGVIDTDKIYSSLTGDKVFYECYGYDTYMLVQPGVTYYVKAEIYFNKIDEECNFDLLDTTIRFNFKLNILSDGNYVRNGQYKTEEVL